MQILTQYYKYKLAVKKRQNENENTGHLKILIMNMIVSNQI